MADRQRFKQVLLNLLTNAVKYTPLDGKVTVSSSTIGTGPIRIVVSDTGAGIPAEKLARLFTPFDRLGAEQTGVEGTGLGLALCQRLMHAMHGSIGVDSTVGSGSSFGWSWPAPILRSSAWPWRNATGLDARTDPRNQRTILYVEDNLSNLTLIEQMLADQPHIKLITAMQGQLGIELARRHSPDLILLDLHLPDLPGWEVLSRLQRDEGHARHSGGHHQRGCHLASDQTPHGGRRPRLPHQTARYAGIFPRHRRNVRSPSGGDPVAPRKTMENSATGDCLTSTMQNTWHGDTRAFGRMKILIIDDEPLNVALLEDMLSEAGYKQLRSVTDSRLALETCDTFAPDLVLLDLMMPHVDGFPSSIPFAPPAMKSFCRSSC